MSMRNNFGDCLYALGQYEHCNTIYDIGAHKAQWSKRYSRVQKGTYHMFEANPDMHIERHNSRKIIGHSVLLSSPEKEGKEIDFFSIDGTGDSYLKEKTVHYEGVEPKKVIAITLDRYVEENNIPLPDVMKLDVQGAELDVLAGGQKCLENSKMVLTEMPIIEYNECAPTFDEYMDYFLEHDFLPIGVDTIHYSREMPVQLDMVFMKRKIKRLVMGK